METNSIVKTLADAKKLLKNKNWIQHDFARAEGGISVYAESISAVAYCLIGAIRAVVGNLEDEFAATRTFRKTLGGGISLAQWNDAEGRTKEEVLDAFDEAISLAIKEEA